MLGLDTALAQRKKEIKEEKDKIKAFEEFTKKDNLLKDFFTGSKDAALTIIDLEDQLEKLNTNLSNFRVAEDYRDVQKEADRVEKCLYTLTNEIILIHNNLDTVNKGLEFEFKSDMSDVKKVYEEVNVHFSGDLSKSLAEVEDFYTKLMFNRKKRLLEQKHTLEYEQKLKQEKADKLTGELDRLMKYLGDHQALDVFISLSNKRAYLESKLEALKKYQSLQLEYRDKLRQLDREQIDQSELTELYLHEAETKLNIIRDYFRYLAKRFYPESVAGLTISNYEGDNQQRYLIDAKIQSDHSDGINNVKIFCYDLTLLFYGQNHHVDFLLHDSRLFDGIDERQKAELFRIVYEVFTDSSKQYIATVNQNQLNEIKKYIDPQLYKEIVEENTILYLTDDDDSEKLLGIKVDINDD